MAMHPWYWPPQTMTLWRNAVEQMIENAVDWEIPYTEYGAKVGLYGKCLRAEWGDFHIMAGPNIHSDLRGHGAPPNSKHWDVEWLAKHHGGPFNKAFSTNL